MGRKKREKKDDNKSSVGVRLGDFLPGNQEESGRKERKEVAPKKKDRVSSTVSDIKARAEEKSYPWNSDIEKRLLSKGTRGAVKKAWRDFLQDQ